MPVLESPYLVYFLLAGLILTFYLISNKRLESTNIEIKNEQEEAGLIEPASLHPVIDPSICLGCAACIPACPEKNVIGIINKKAELISPANCIGHGACRAACPVNAITLVFGTEKRGVDIPHVKPSFETNVPGVFIAGELGGMGLIRNAIEQGKQAMDSIIELLKSKENKKDVLDVVIVGAGPAGFSASLAAIERKIKFVTLEQDTLGGAVSNYPRGKIVMTQPAFLPIIGKTHFREINKEQLLAFWKNVETKTDLKINYCERVIKVNVLQDCIETITEKSQYKSHFLLLSIGRRGTPRKLDVPGEDLPKVVYKMVDPQQYTGQQVLVVGGGDSALEAAVSLAQIPTTEVTISYRGDAFARCKKKNREGIDYFQKENKLRIILKSTIKKITDHEVVIDQEGQEIRLKNQAVIICAGGVLPTPFLKEIGIKIETKFGTA